MGFSWKTTILSTVMDSVRSTVKVLLVDADASARNRVCDYLVKFCPDHHIVGQAATVADAFRLARESRPNLIFLNIELVDETGFDLLDKLTDKNLQVIFTSTSDAHALKAFKYNAVDYLLKPIVPEELTQAVDRAEAFHAHRLQHMLQMMKGPDQVPGMEKIALPTQEGLTMMTLSQVVRLQSDGGYTTLWSSEGESCLVSRSIGEFENTLPSSHFLRVHTSHVINLDFVKKFLREDGGFALMCDGSKIPVARRRKELFLDMLRGKSVF